MPGHLTQILILGATGQKKINKKTFILKKKINCSSAYTFFFYIRHFLFFFFLTYVLLRVPVYEVGLGVLVSDFVYIKQRNTLRAARGIDTIFLSEYFFL